MFFAGKSIIPSAPRISTLHLSSLHLTAGKFKIIQEILASLWLVLIKVKFGKIGMLGLVSTTGLPCLLTRA